jgi:hypothetical protein
MLRPANTRPSNCFTLFLTLEWTITWVWLADPSRRAGWNELDHDIHQLDARFSVSHQCTSPVDSKKLP